MPEARMLRIGAEARHAFEEPLTDRPVGVVIVRVHGGIEDRPVGLDGVPPLPDRRRPALDLIEPAGDLLLKEHGGGELGFTDLDQRREERWSPDEPGADAPMGAGDGRLEVALGRLDVLGRDEVVHECEGV